MNYQQNALKRQSSVTKQEQSVERLKSCIADLKKLASNKGKRGGTTNGIDQPPSFGQNSNGYHIEEESSKSSIKPSTANSVHRSKQKLSTQGSSHQYERKTHQTKIANALKKYISEIEQTTSTNPHHRDQKRESHRHKSASNKKRSSRLESNSKKPESQLGSSKRQNSKSNLHSQKKNFENSLRSSKTDMSNTQSSKPTRKAQSQERTSHHQPPHQDRDKSYISSNVGRSANDQYQYKNSSQVPRSASCSTHQPYHRSSSTKKYRDENQAPLTQNNSAIITQKYNQAPLMQAKERKPFTFNSYIQNQSEIQNYKTSANVITTTSKVNDKNYMNNSDHNIDQRLSQGPSDSFIMQNNQNATTNSSQYYGLKKAYEYKPSEMRSSSQESGQRYQLSNNNSNLNMKHEVPSHFGLSAPESQNTSMYMQKLQPREMAEIYPQNVIHEQRREDSKQRNSQERRPDQKKEIGRSLQELAQMTQSTDFSENRIQSLDQKKFHNNLNTQQTQNPAFPSSIYSIQHPNSQISVPYCHQTNSISLAQNNMTQGIGALMRTHVSREDFNIEDLHMQVVNKMQRSKQLIKEIEAYPSEKDPDYMLEDMDFNSSGYKGKYGTKRRNSNGRKDYIPPSLVVPVNEEILCGDGCSRPAINYKKKN